MTMSSRELRIRDLLQKKFSPLYLEIQNESHMHAGPQSESHYKILIVSDFFVGLSRIDRQRQVNALLKVEFETGLHALTQRVLTPGEWGPQKDQGLFESPACAGKKTSN